MAARCSVAKKESTLDSQLADIAPAYIDGVLVPCIPFSWGGQSFVVESRRSSGISI